MLSGARGLIVVPGMGAVEQPCKLLYTAMFNTAFAGDTEREFMSSQLVFYINFEDRPVTEDEKVKTIGIVQGINDFGAKFAGAGLVSHIDTDTTRMVMANVEGGYWLCMAIRFAVDVNRDGNAEHTSRGLAPPEYLQNVLKESYQLWRLNHGCLEGHKAPELEEWWQKWCLGRFSSLEAYNLTNLGFMSLFPGYKKSSIKLPVSFKTNIDIRVEQFLQESQALGMCVVNTNRFPFKNFGLVYHSQIEQASLVSLVGYLETMDLVVGLTPSVLTSDNIPVKQELSFFERSLVTPTFETLNTVFNPVTMTMDAVSTLTTFTSRIIPPQLNFWSSNEATPEPAPVAPEVEGKYLIGNTLEGITRKTVHLDKQYSLVLYEVCGMMFCLLFDPQKDLSGCYDGLEAQLKELYRIYLSDLTLQQVKDMDSEPTKSPFYYVLYDREQRHYESSFPSIPDPDTHEGLTRTQTLHLHNCIIGFVLRNRHDNGLSEKGRLLKTGKNWWVLETKVGDKTLVIARRFDTRDTRKLKVLDRDSYEEQASLVSSLGPDVLEWFEQITTP